MKLGLSIPLYNEEACAERVVRALMDELRREGVEFQLALVNNGSRDGTREVIEVLAAENEEVTAVHLEENAGYGGGILEGVAALESDVVGWHWGDGQIAPETVVAVWRGLEGSRYGLAKARRVERRDGAQRVVVTRCYNALMRLFGVRSRDVNGCPKMMTRERFELLAPSSRDWFLDPEVVLRARELGLEWVEIEATMEPRLDGASKVKGETVVEFLWNLGRWGLGSERF